MSYIYKITNIVNNKVYIGKTNNTVAQRFKQHISEAFQPRSWDRPLYRAMRKYGVENFNIECIEETNNPEEREKYYIQYFHSYVKDEQCNGYNATTGGDGRPYDFTADEISTIIQLYNQFISIDKIAEIVRHDRATVTNKLIDLGFTIDCHRILRMPVYQLDKQTNQIINCYSSIHEAARIAFNDDTKNAHIRECCRGLRKTAYGYKWMFVKDYENNN